MKRASYPAIISVLAEAAAVSLGRHWVKSLNIGADFQTSSSSLPSITGGFANMTSFTGFCFSGGIAFGDLGALRFEGVEPAESAAEERSGVEVAEGVGAGIPSTLSVMGGEVVCANAIGESKHT